MRGSKMPRQSAGGRRGRKAPEDVQRAPKEKEVIAFCSSHMGGAPALEPYHKLWTVLARLIRSNRPLGDKIAAARSHLNDSAVELRLLA